MAIDLKSVVFAIVVLGVFWWFISNYLGTGEPGITPHAQITDNGNIKTATGNSNQGSSNLEDNSTLPTPAYGEFIGEEELPDDASNSGEDIGEENGSGEDDGDDESDNADVEDSEEEDDLAEGETDIRYYFFTASYCSTCETMEPWIYEVAAEHPTLQVRIIDVESNNPYVDKFDVAYTATSVIVTEQNGKPLSGMKAIGYMPKEGIEAFACRELKDELCAERGFA